MGDERTAINLTKIADRILTLRHPLIVMAVIGLAIRFILAPFLTYLYDTASWALVVENIWAGYRLYGATGYFYPPVWGYILWGIGDFVEFIGIDTILTSPPETAFLEMYDEENRIATITFSFIVKTVLIIGDLAVAIMLFLLAKEFTEDKRVPVLAFSVWMLLPAAIVVSSLSTMFDNLCVLAFLISVYCMMRGRYGISGVAFGISVTSKFFPLFAVVALILFIWNREEDVRAKTIAVSKFVVATALISLVIFAPQLADGTFDKTLLFLTDRIGIYGLNMVNSLKLIALSIAALAVLYVITRIINHFVEDRNRALIISILVPMLLVIMVDYHPQYFIQVFPFIILLAMIYDSRYSLPLILLAVGATIKVIAVWAVMLIPLAVYTDLITVDTVRGLIVLTEDGMSPNIMSWTFYLGDLFILVGLSLLVWVMASPVIIKYLDTKGRNCQE